MVTTRDSSSVKAHLLSFFTDDENSSALTLLVNGVRFHIIADAKALVSKSKAGRSLQKEYADLATVLRPQSSSVETKDERGSETQVGQQQRGGRNKDGEELWCSCHNPSNGQQMIACENEDCQVEWFHFSCVGLSSVPEGEWYCPSCREQNADTGDEESEKEEEETRSPSAADSGVDVSSPVSLIPEAKIILSGFSLESVNEEAEKQLQQWMLKPFSRILTSMAPEEETQIESKTLEQWYAPPTHFFDLRFHGSELAAVELEESDELRQAMEALVPRLPMPGYITSLDLPWYRPSELQVLDTSDSLGPLRPSRVRIGEKEYFVKIVDMTQPGPTKREIKVLRQIESLGLHKQFHVPQVVGLVRFGDNDGSGKKNNIMGFLQTEIQSPTPLTEMIDTDVPQKRREKWAKESERIVALLHEHGLVFGDCKADNFLVDQQGELWIIDFGGSYTEGWIDAELNETEEGDDMGVRKIAGALADPDGNTLDEEEEDGNENGESPKHEAKNKAVDRPEMKDQEDTNPRKRVRDGESDTRATKAPRMS